MWYRAYAEVIEGVVHLGEEVPWDDEGLQVELAWTRIVLTMVYTVGQRIVTDYDLSII